MMTSDKTTTVKNHGTEHAEPIVLMKQSEYLNQEMYKETAQNSTTSIKHNLLELFSGMAWNG